MRGWIGLFFSMLFSTTMAQETMPTPASSSNPASSPASSQASVQQTRFVKYWACESEVSQKTTPPMTREVALQQARDFDLISSYAKIHGPFSKEMRQVNPDLIILHYSNSAFKGSTGPGKQFPKEWFCQTKDGYFMRSHGFGNWLMDPTNEGWREWISKNVNDVVTEGGFDGVFYDMMGIAPLRSNYCGLFDETGKEVQKPGEGKLSPNPINQATGKIFTHEEWIKANNALANYTKEKYPRVIIGGNGFVGATPYFHDEYPLWHLWDSSDYMCAEAWMIHPPNKDPNTYPSFDVWKDNVDMLIDAGQRNKHVLCYTKVNTRGTKKEDVEKAHKHALASFLLGTDGNAYFLFTNGLNEHYAKHRYWTHDPGTPKGKYAEVGTTKVFMREFTGDHGENNVVVVNPNNEERTFNLGEGNYRNLDDEEVSGVVKMAGNSGDVFLGNQKQ